MPSWRKSFCWRKWTHPYQTPNYGLDIAKWGIFPGLTFCPPLWTLISSWPSKPFLALFHFLQLVNMALGASTLLSPFFFLETCSPSCCELHNSGLCNNGPEKTVRSPLLLLAVPSRVGHPPYSMGENHPTLCYGALLLPCPQFWIGLTSCLFCQPALALFVLRCQRPKHVFNIYKLVYLVSEFLVVW